MCQDAACFGVPRRWGVCGLWNVWGVHCVGRVPTACTSCCSSCDATHSIVAFAADPRCMCLPSANPCRWHAFRACMASLPWLTVHTYPVWQFTCIIHTFSHAHRSVTRGTRSPSPQAACSGRSAPAQATLAARWACVPVLDVLVSDAPVGDAPVLARCIDAAHETSGCTLYANRLRQCLILQGCSLRRRSCRSKTRTERHTTCPGV